MALRLRSLMQVLLICAAVPDELPHRERLTLPPSATLGDALKASALIQGFPAFDLTACGYAIFGQRATLATPLREADRIEVCRPLRVDPMTARRLRAQKPLHAASQKTSRRAATAPKRGHDS